ncbi:HDOD domain-containing protein [Herminiimonas sp. CN]|uniref:HDOD domain-containing protein n=1 Tax=Herminiimonas sp. CN TaxID=1349818 RepID=UPI000553A38A|nr:HDOD domain-containing protein [Herminiimonas sp. CN]
MSISTTTPGNLEQTLELLWLRVRERGDLPGFSKVVNAIVRAMRGEEDREFCMTRTVLSDPALTQRVLRLANSAMYSAFGRKINTVSKAIMVLGIESIGHLALGLKLIDDLSAASSNSEEARGEMEKAVLAGYIGRQLAASATTGNVEEAVVCSILHSLGRMMTVFYLPDLWSKLQLRRAAAGQDETRMVDEVLGAQFDELGRRIAQHWGLPESLISSMQDILPKPSGDPVEHRDRLAALSTMSSGCAQILCSDSPSAPAALAQMVDGYAGMLGLDVTKVMAAVETVRKSTNDDPLFVSTGKSLKRAPGSGGNAAAWGKPADAATLLSAGVADLRGVLTTANSAQMVAMALEIIYRGLGFSRAISFLRSTDHTKYCARLGFGDGVQEMLARLEFSKIYQPDVFHAALAHDKITFIENTKAPNFANKLPQWWKEALPTARSFIVLPLTANQQPIGFIYADWDESLARYRLDPIDIIALNELRMMIGKSIESRAKQLRA